MKVRWCSCCFLHRPTVRYRLPPTLQVAVVKDGTGVEFSSSYCNGRSATAKVNRRGRRCVGVRVASSIAQLSVIVQPPTLQVAVVKDGAGVGISNSHRNGRSARAEVDGGG